MCIRDRSYVIPYVAPPPFTTGSNQPSRQRAAFQGATVIEPVAGIHKFVNVFDFNSMYVFILLKYNLCYTTWMPNGSVPGAFSMLKVKHSDTFDTQLRSSDTRLRSSDTRLRRATFSFKPTCARAS